jgi:L-ascorbate metabolism protein UlaG (beta-lactamase superfamily)
VRFPKSDHCDGERFHNPSGIPLQPFSKLPRLLREPRVRWPRWIEEPQRKPPALGDAEAAVTFLGHATFLIQTRIGNVLTDPMWSMRAGPFGLLGPRRVRKPGIALEDLPPITAVLLSHGHYDHLDLRTLRELARRFDPIVVSPLGHGKLVRSTGIRMVVELDWWEETAIGDLRVTSTPAQHFSARTPWDRNRALWGGFVLQVDGARIYFAGDSAYAGFFPEIRRRFAPFQLALLPIGAYEPRWFMRAVHMNPEEAVRAHVELGSPPSVAMHFGTFQLTPEGIDEPVRELVKACDAAGVARSRFRVLGTGESVFLQKGV